MAKYFITDVSTRIFKEFLKYSTFGFVTTTLMEILFLEYYNYVYHNTFHFYHITSQVPLCSHIYYAR